MYFDHTTLLLAPLCPLLFALFPSTPLSPITDVHMCVGVGSSAWTWASGSVSEGNQLNARLVPVSPPLEPGKPPAVRARLLTDRIMVRAHNSRFAEFLRAPALSCVEDAAWQQSSPSSGSDNLGTVSSVFLLEP